VIKVTKKHKDITVGEPSLETRRSLWSAGSLPRCVIRQTYLTLGGGAGGRSLGSIFCITRIAGLYLLLLCRCVSVRSITVEKHELSKVEFEIIDKALKALQQSNLDPVTADKVTDLRNMFQDAYTGWLEIYEEAA
jgi:hypothetical protein